MADVTTTFGAKDTGVAATIQRLQNKLTAFQASMTSVSASAKKMQSSFSSLGRNVIGLAAAYVGVTQAIAAFNKALGTADRLDDLSVITGETAGNLAVLERAFDNTGVGGDRMLPMLARMTQFIKDLEKGTPRATDAAKLLGISFDQLKRLAPIDRFKLLTRAIGDLRSENDRNNASTEVFGTRAGILASLLANDLDGALTTAREQLGSMVKILDESGRTLGDLNDTLKNSVFNKPSEFTIGFLAGIQGANDFAEALSNIDAAGFGQKIGKMFASMAQNPGSGFLLFGEVLLLAVKNAGNALANSMIFAADVYKTALSNPTTFRGLMDGLLAGFQMIFNFAASMTQTIVKTFVQGLAGIASLIPGIGPALARSISEPIASIERLQEETVKQGEALRKRMNASMGSTSSDILTRAQSIPRPNEDFFGAANQKQEVNALTARLSQLGASQGNSESDKLFAQINQIYRDEVEKIHAATKDRAEQVRRLETLRAQYRQAAGNIIGKYGDPSVMYAPPPVQQARDAAMSQPARQDVINATSGKSASAMDEVASETTLQKVANFLEQLNTKLPQPVLV